MTSMGALGAAMLMSTAAHAQDTAETPPASVPGDIVVTALHRASTVQTTPLSIAAISGDTLAKTGATQMTDYFRQVPNLNVTASQGGSNRISIRGVNAAGEATVGLYYDETPVTGPSGTTQDSGGVAADMNLFDVERVEVLRGPQGTLYGSSSMAGTLRIIFNKPDYKKYDAATEEQVSSTAHGSMGYFFKGMVNIPIITDKLAVRVVAYDEKRPGWIDNVRFGTKDINDSTNWGVRGLIGYKPDDKTTITAMLTYQKSSAKDQQGWYPGVGLYQTNSPAQLPFNTRMQLYNLKGDRALGFATLTATASYYKYQFLRAYDFSASTAAYANSTAACPGYYGQSTACSTAQFSAYQANGLAQLPAIGYQPAYVRSQNYEVRLASDDHMPAWLQWTVGSYFEKRHDHIDSQTVSGDPATGAVYMPLRYFSYRYVETDERQIAGFGEVSLKPLPGLTITGGARYYDYQKTTSGQSYLGNVYTGSVAAPYTSVQASANGWLEKANVSYKVNQRVMVYTSASKGFRPGGANNIPVLPANLLAYKADSLWNYEIGLKSSWLDNHLIVNGAIFDVEWSNMQTAARTADGLYSFLTNAGKARIRGGEIDITARPIRGITLTGAAGYSNAHLTQDQSNSAVLVTTSTGKNGDLIPNTPAWTASSSAAYNWAINSRIDGMVRVDFAYTGAMQSTFRKTDPYYTAYGNYATVNLRAGIEKDRWGVYVFCQNIGDKVGNVGVTNGFGYTGLTYSIQPRTIGLNVHFGL
jgi:outer membrane receptor protein involved in Fe transport